MSKQIDQTRFTTDFFEILDETFENHHGIFLDKGTSLFQTLAEVNASEASRPVGNKCATLAAQVAHLTFYLQVLDQYIRTGEIGKVDWGEIWRTVGAVTPEEWAALNQDLQTKYRSCKTMLENIDDWGGERPIGGALAIVVLTAYHLGEIRQALCTLK